MKPMTIEELREHADVMRAVDDPQALYDFGAALGELFLVGVITKAQARELMLRAAFDNRATATH